MTSRTHRPLLLILTVLAVVAGACSDDGSSATPATTTPDAAATDTSPTTRPAPVAYDPSVEVDGDTLTITTSDGPVHGSEVDGTRQFLAIPYAAPPVGDLRWRPPQEPEAWTEPLDATTPPASCPQVLPIGETRVIGQEDCLYLNVYAAAPPADELAPVMVWIHGGGFTVGNSQENVPDMITRRTGVVTVSLNYRLGQLGFLAEQALADEHPDGAAGTLGLEDQQAALRWVQDNIAAFGGDPANVTIFGESAGGMSVCNQLVSPGAEGLFARAIIESGPCQSFGPTREQALAQGARFAEALGCDDGDAAAVVACMRAVPVEEVIQTLPPSRSFIFDITSVWIPTLDGVVLPAERDVYTTGQFHQVPVLLGANANEGALFVGLAVANGSPPVTDDNWSTTIDDFFGTDLADGVRSLYPLEDYPDPGAAFGQPVGDAVMLCPVRDTADAIAPHTPTYLYRFDHTGSPFVLPLGDIELGAFHSAELPFVFGQQVLSSGAFTFDADQQQLSDEMMGYWTRFAATGDPNGDGAPTWPRYEPETREHLVLDTGELVTGTAMSQERCDFWAEAGWQPPVATP